jgi:hypothetical protein
MTTRIYYMDEHLAKLVEAFAKDCGRTFNEAVALCLVNGMSLALGTALDVGGSSNVALMQRLNRKAKALAKTHDAPMMEMEQRHVHFREP